LDFAAQTCTSRAPLCESCGLVSICDFGRKRLAAERKGQVE
jgi:adenine-specific DNA glycosylase